MKRSRTRVGMPLADKGLKMTGDSEALVYHNDRLPGRLRCNLGSDTFTREYFEENGMRNPTVDDMGFADASAESIQTGMDLGQHPLADRAFLDHPLHIFAGDGREVAPIRIANPFYVGHHDQLFGIESSGHGASDQIGIDIIRVSFPVGPDR